MCYDDDDDFIPWSERLPWADEYESDPGVWEDTKGELKRARSFVWEQLYNGVTFTFLGPLMILNALILTPIILPFFIIKEVRSKRWKRNSRNENKAKSRVERWEKNGKKDPYKDSSVRKENGS